MEDEQNYRLGDAAASGERDASPTFRALLIGIDFYYPNRLPSGASFAPLRGCVSDVERVEEMLKRRVKGPYDIKKLVARDTGAGRPATPREGEQLPTYDNMKKAFDALVDEAQPGDQVYIHYSGHGARVPTKCSHVKGGGTYDETLVPMDIREDSTRHLRDLDLAYYLDKLSRKQVIVTVLLDSCHSGGATRGIDVAPRCATGARAGVDPTLDTTERPMDGVAPDEELCAAWERLAAAGAATRAEVGTTWLPASNHYVLLAACRDRETAIEDNLTDAPREGAQRGGVMTAAFLEALEQLGSDHTWKTCYERVLARVHSRYPSQTPQLLGRAERQILGVELRPIAHTVTVAEIDRTNRKVKLRAGLATATATGSRFGLYRPGTTNFAERASRVGSATVTQVMATESWADLDEGTSIDAIELGAPALLEDVGSVKLQHQVNLFRRSDLPREIDQERALDRLRDAIETRGRGFFVLQTTGTPRYQVAINERNQYEIWDPSGEPMPYVGAVNVDAPSAAEHVVDRLIHIFRFQTIEEIDLPTSELKSAIRVELRAPPPEWSPGKRIEGGTVIEPGSEGYVLKPGTYSFVHVHNAGARRVNVVALVLEEDYRIDPVMPPGPAWGPYMTVDPGDHLWFALESVLRPDRESARDTIKIFATVDDTDFWWLLHAPIDQPVTRSMRTRSGAARDALFRLREALDADENTDRAVRTVPQPGSDWATRQFRVIIAR